MIQGSRNRASELRGLVADTVLEDPLQWNEAVLGKDPAEYARWIRDPKRWGGAIELSIVSQHFGIEVAAFDIQTKRVDIYGQGRGYRERVLVVYDGASQRSVFPILSIASNNTMDIQILSIIDVSFPLY